MENITILVEWERISSRMFGTNTRPLWDSLEINSKANPPARFRYLCFNQTLAVSSYQSIPILSVWNRQGERVPDLATLLHEDFLYELRQSSAERLFIVHTAALVATSTNIMRHLIQFSVANNM